MTAADLAGGQRCHPPGTGAKAALTSTRSGRGSRSSTPSLAWDGSWPIEGEGSGRKGRVAFAVGPARTFILAKSPLRPVARPAAGWSATARNRRSPAALDLSAHGCSNIRGESQTMPRLGVNIDHVATLRQARGGREPDPVWAAVLAELGGADGITIHLREDRRHIQDRDLRLLRQTVQVRLNLELAVEPASSIWPWSSDPTR